MFSLVVFIFLFFLSLNVLYWSLVLIFMISKSLSTSYKMITDLLLHTGSLSSYSCITDMSVFLFFMWDLVVSFSGNALL